MVGITSLKARLARLRLGSDFDDKHPELADPVTRERRKKSKAKKAAQEPYNEYTKNTGGKRKKNNKLTSSDQKRGKKDKEKVRGSYNRTKRQEGSTQEYSGFGEYVKNTGDKRKKKNKLTRSDQKRGKKVKRKRIKDWHGNTGTVDESGNVIGDHELIRSLEENNS